MATTFRASGSTAGPSTRITSHRAEPRHRGRIGRKSLEIAALLAIAVLLCAAPAITRSHAGDFATSTVLAEKGDTLWTIAREHPVPGLSTAEAVEVIAELNALSDAQIPAGMAVEVPASQEKVALALK